MSILASCARSGLILSAVFCLALAGCGGSPPEIVPASGLVLLDGEPLEHARVRFLPLHEGLDGNYTATAVTDENGKFELSAMGGQQSGCCSCLCKVTVSEGPIPDEMRAGGQSSYQAIADFREKLKNRPIPGRYAKLSTTPLTYQVSPDKSDYKIELKR